jgi:pimeloyl-ACP methyl ester carboxylesterase
VAGLLDYLKIPSADIIGYSLGGGVAMQCAIRYPEKVRKVVSISARFRQDGLVKEGLDAFSKLTPEAFKGSPIEIESREKCGRILESDSSPYICEESAGPRAGCRRDDHVRQVRKSAAR